MERLVIMEFMVRVVADAATPEADLERMMKRSATLLEGFKITALAILPPGLDCDVEILDEPEVGA